MGTDHRQRLIEKANDRSAVMGVVGLGYVGLPLAAEFAHAGYRVVGYDVSQRVVDLIQAGRSHIGDVASGDLAPLVSSGKITATTDERRLAEVDAISICVPTPLSKTRDPDVSYVVSATNAVRSVLRPGQAVVLESTTYPGTTREIMLPVLEESGLTVGEDFFLAFSPERVDPGNEVWKTKNTPKVIGGITPACLEVASALYGAAVDRIVEVTSAESAELTKLLENTFRSVNIGLANEMAIICDKLNVDVWEVIEAAATKPFGYMKFLPGPGIGGHCIPIDPHYLAWRMRALNYTTRFIDVASEVNSEMPLYWVRKVQDALNHASKPLKGSRVLILGVAYKRDIDDMRESPALDIIRLLESHGADVTYHDPFVSEFTEDGVTRRSVALDVATVKSTDCVVVVTDHSGVDYDMVAENAQSVVDTRHIMSRVNVRER